MDNIDTFIWKRLHRFGNVCSKDLELSFDITNVHASRLIKKFLQENPQMVYKEGRFLYLYPNTEIPQSILNSSLLDDFSLSNKPQITGLFSNEFPVIISDIGGKKKTPDNVLLAISKAIQEQKKIEVVYIDFELKKSPNEKQKPIVIFPVGFVFEMGSMQLVAINFNNNNKIELFSIFRLNYIKTLNKSTILKDINVYKKVTLILTISDLLTEEQRDSLALQFNLIKLNDKQYFINIFEYEKDYLTKTHFNSDFNPHFVSYEIIDNLKSLHSSEEIIVKEEPPKISIKEERIISFTNTLKELIKDNPNITQVGIAKQLNLSKQAVSSKLKNYGIDLEALKNNINQ